MNVKVRLFLFLHRHFGLKPKSIIKYCGISRATFYRYKKRLNGTMVRTKR